MSKRIKILLFLTVLLLGLAWYFFKGYNYKVTFKIHESPSVVYNNILIWNDNKPAKDSAVVNLGKIASKKVVQQYRLGDTLLSVQWKLKQLNDSTTKVIANITDKNNPLLGNINAINPNSAFSVNSKNTIKRFANVMSNYSKTIRISNIKKDAIPAKYCAYISLKSTTDTKAKVMRDNIYKVMNYIKGNAIELQGDPFLEVTTWNSVNDSIAFDFCFPIKRQDSLPPTNTVKFKQNNVRKALRAKFNGNYRDSHQAWRTLLDYANFNVINVEKLPVEFFLNDPHTGTNPQHWEADIYLPLKE